MIERACQKGRGDGFTIPGAEPSYGPDLALEPVHCAIEVAVEIEAERATSHVTTTVRCNRPGARTLRLDAVDFDDVSVSGPDEWRYDGKAIELTWTEPFAAGEERDVSVRYRVEKPISGMHFSAPDEAYPRRPLFVVTDHETERARYWLPCVDYPTVRTTFDFKITAPAELTILASGTCEAETDNGDGTKTAHWKLDYPCPSYLCCFGAGRFSRFSDESVDGRPIEYYGAEHTDPQSLQRAFGKTPGMMRWLVDRLGVPFPFPKYFQLAIAHGLMALLDHPDQLETLRNNPEAMRPAVEEILRWSSPVAYFARRATRDTEIRGVKIKKGDRVTLWYPSANRDEEVFEDPFRFDIARMPNQHVSFGGGGAHFCLGANLARREIAIIFEELLARTQKIEIIKPIQYSVLGIYNPILVIPQEIQVRMS